MTPNPNADVRMRGFAERATVEQTLAWLDAQLPAFERLPTETVGLSAAAGRVPARDVASRVDVPSFDRSMMDGFAVRAEDTYGATPYNPLPLRIIGTCLPGEPFAGRVERGTAVRIMTGAPLPAGADGVLPVEETEIDGTGSFAGRPGSSAGGTESSAGRAGEMLSALGAVSIGKHVGGVGEDVRTGDMVVRAGRALRPQDIGLLSSIGSATVEVVRRPRVRIVTTGNELLPAGTVPSGCRIADANGPMLAALVARDGGEAICGDIVPDRPEAIRAALEAATRENEAEVVVVSGGSSVGQEDYVPKLLSELGELAIHGVAMRPSSPTGMGRLGGRLVFLLPGNPVSCLCAYDFFAGRAIRALAGGSKDWPHRRVRVRLTRKLVSTVGRVDYARVQIVGREAEPLAVSGASILSSTTRADGFVIVPADSEGYPPGAEIEVFLY
jgi:molybdopterin molybdotransferase